MPPKRGPNCSKSAIRGLPSSTVVPGKFVDIHMMENYLNEEFGDEYSVKIRYNQCIIETMRPLSEREIEQFSNQPHRT
ncbi:hypothetical protein F4804DRAFT_207736 [Jackrogersella minutella]|nr:hypothetical protein F4804DRAFT_207736 [Jackrogersella minutella]